MNCVNPGFCVSNLRSTLPDFLKESNAKSEAEAAFTTEEGSRQLVYAAVGGADNEEELRGAYIDMSEVKQVSEWVLSKTGREAEDRLWVCCACLFLGVDFVLILFYRPKRWTS